MIRLTPAFSRPWLIAALLWGGPYGLAQEGIESAANSDELPLPVWSSEEWRRLSLESAPPLLGGLLPGLGEGASPPAPQGTHPVIAPRYPDGPPAVFEESLNSLRDGLSLFLPEGLPSVGRDGPSDLNRRPTPEIQLAEVTPEFLDAAAAWPLDDLLIDPGSELPETQAEDLRRFLGYHAEESRLPLRVLLLARDEKLPALDSLTSLENLGGGSVINRRAVLLVYPMGEPWRARLFLPSAAHQAVSTAYLTRLFDGCLNAAATASQEEGQLHEFVVQLSIRLFWLEKELSQRAPAALAPVTADAPDTPLSEVGSHTAPVPAPLPTPAPATAGLLPLSLDLPTASLVTIAALLSFLLVLAFLRLIRGAKKAAHERRHRLVWTLPEQEAETRLGGAFCGGGGAWSQWK